MPYAGSKANLTAALLPTFEILIKNFIKLSPRGPRQKREAAKEGGAQVCNNKASEAKSEYYN